jgi:lipoprotein-releasing system permease protein
MNLELFIAKRLFSSRDEQRRISKPAVTIAQWGVAVGTVVMIVSMCIVVGFKHEVRDKIIGFGSHIQVSNYYESDANGELPVTTTEKDLKELAANSGIKSVQTYVSKTGLIAAGEEFEGVIVKGIGNNYDTSFFASHIVEGTLPLFSDTAASNKIVLSRATAKKLKAKEEQK